MSFREKRQTGGQTDIQDDRIQHSSGILNKKDDEEFPKVYLWFFSSGLL